MVRLFSADCYEMNWTQSRQSHFSWEEVNRVHFQVANTMYRCCDEGDVDEPQGYIESVLSHAILNCLAPRNEAADTDFIHASLWSDRARGSSLYRATRPRNRHSTLWRRYSFLIISGPIIQSSRCCFSLWRSWLVIGMAVIKIVISEGVFS